MINDVLKSSLFSKNTSFNNIPPFCFISSSSTLSDQSYESLMTNKDVVAEWLRRQPAKLMGLPA
jgi:hypothetical protein